MLNVYATSLHRLPPFFNNTTKPKLLEYTQTDVLPSQLKQEVVLKKGWNYFSAPKEGIDVLATFGRSSAVEYVVAYEPLSKQWASFSPSNVHANRVTLHLKSIEPNTPFFVLASDATIINIVSKTMDITCKKYANDGRYEVVVDFGNNDNISFNIAKRVGIKSRYFLNHTRGVYDDSRVALIVPKLDDNSSTRYRYGPATPKITLHFSKAYENQIFYIFDYKYNHCYKGIFPSLRVPPFPMLKKL